MSFLPLSADETPLASTRGQHLPGLIQSRSSASLAAMSMRPRRLSRMNTITTAELSRKRSVDSMRAPSSPTHPPLLHAYSGWGGGDGNSERRMSHAAVVLMTPQVRSQRLIGNNNPRYKWERYYTSEEDLKKVKNKAVRKYYERNNFLIQNYMYIDRLLDSSLPHDLIQEYQSPSIVAKEQRRKSGSENGGLFIGESVFTNGTAAATDLPEILEEEPSPDIVPRLYNERHGSFDSILADGAFDANGSDAPKTRAVKRTPRDLYSIKKHPNGDQSSEREPLLRRLNTQGDEETGPMPPDFEPEEETDSQSPIVTAAIIVNLIANTALLIMKIIVVLLSSSISVLASLVDAALDFLSTAIVGITTRLIARTDQYAYPIGRRRLEPVGVLVFSVIMITAFLQVFSQAFLSLTNGDHEIVELSPSAIAIMASTVVVKFACWLWCRLIKNSSVQALAQDAMTDVVFNIFSIIFPLVGFYAGIWWLDPLGGVVLSLYVIINWSRTASEHIRNLTGASASADERNILLYLTMRFAKTIKQIQGLQAYHSGDKLNVEVDIVLDENTSLRDSHDLGESLQYVLESVPSVDRAFVHMDYNSYNLPTHMSQDA